MKKGKVIVIHQPDFMPYLGFFHRLLHSDVLIVLDHVQLIKDGWQHRDKIKGPNGEYWLTVPINRKIQKPAINEAQIDYSHNWGKKHLKTITQFYKNSPFFDVIFPEITKIYNRNYSLLLDLNIAFLRFFCEFFSLQVIIIHSSTLPLKTKRSQLLCDIAKVVGGTHYLSGMGAKDYFDISPFRHANIEVIWQNFKHPVYPQLHGDFIPYLSCLDFAMNCGPTFSKYFKLSS